MDYLKTVKKAYRKKKGRKPSKPSQFIKSWKPQKAFGRGGIKK